MLNVGPVSWEGTKTALLRLPALSLLQSEMPSHPVCPGTLLRPPWLAGRCPGGRTCTLAPSHISSLVSAAQARAHTNMPSEQSGSTGHICLHYKDSARPTATQMTDVSTNVCRCLHPLRGTQACVSYPPPVYGACRREEVGPSDTRGGAHARGAGIQIGRSRRGLTQGLTFSISSIKGLARSSSILVSFMHAR